MDIKAYGAACEHGYLAVVPITSECVTTVLNTQKQSKLPRTKLQDSRKKPSEQQRSFFAWICTTVPPFSLNGELIDNNTR
jgi:hypothetical protein